MQVQTNTRLVALLVALAAMAWTGGSRQGALAGASARLVAFEAVPAFEGATCSWEVAEHQSPAAAASASRTDVAAYQLPGSAAAAARLTATDSVAGRAPLRFIQDPYPGFSSVSVDPVRNEVVFNDENRFRILVYDRLANTSSPTTITDPKRVIGGLKTKSQYSSTVYADPKDGNIFVVNNDTVHDLTIFGRQAKGDVAPDRVISGTPYGSFGMAVDEGTQEMFFTVQHAGAVMVFPKSASQNDAAARMILGDQTLMADPHGIAFDSKNKVIYVANWGTSRTPVGAANAGPTDYPRSAVPGSGRFAPPSITVYPADGHGNVAPLRVIQGPRTQLNWPTGISFDAERQELYVANAVGDAISVFAASARGDVAPVRILKGARTLLKNPAGVAVDVANNEVWVANFGGHSGTVYRRDASGDVAPLRIIRSAPASEPTTLISNPYSIAYNAGREEIIVPNCVAQPRIGTFEHLADKNAAPIRMIQGSNTKLNRTVHGVSYDELHDEIMVSSQIGQAILTFRGTGSGDEAPIRVIQGPKTRILLPEMVETDPVHDELFVPARNQVLVFNRTDAGDVAPKRILNSRGALRVAVDYVHNFMAVSGGNQIAIFDRTAEGDSKPLRVIKGPHATVGNARWGFDIYSPTGQILVSVPKRGGGEQDFAEEQASEDAFVGIWSVYDDGDAAPEWTIGGPKGVLRQPRGVAADPKNKTIIISDKYLNGVLTYALPEMFEPAAASPRQTARAEAR